MIYTPRMVCIHSPHSSHHVSTCCSPHGLHGILHMLVIMSPYAILHMVIMTSSTCLYSCLHMLLSTWCEYILHMVRMTFSTCLTSCLHMLCSTWFTWYPPHGKIMPPYVVLHMVFMTYSTCPPSCLHMLFSTWFSRHSPHCLYHVSICYSPHGSRGILHILYIMSPYAILHMVCMALSTLLTSCLHMLFSTWFVWHFPHAFHHVSIRCSPHGLAACVLMLVTIYHGHCETLRTHCHKA